MVVFFFCLPNSFSLSSTVPPIDEADELEFGDDSAEDDFLHQSQTWGVPSDEDSKDASVASPEGT